MADKVTVVVNGSAAKLQNGNQLGDGTVSAKGKCVFYHPRSGKGGQVTLNRSGTYTLSLRGGSLQAKPV
jgi:hypothetical protein